jgi:uncharacterized protein YbcC (UPF0753/DUF2309 family)
LNHATNALCIVGRRSLTRHVYLDRRAFLNSYDYQTDPDGEFLTGILNAVIPVCGGINLEYYFSRTDQTKLGAGSKLPHNVVGLFGVTNGFEGDLRTGLPAQMTEVHDPLRLLLIVEHYPETVSKLIQQIESIREPIMNEWIHLVVIHPEYKKCYWFNRGEFKALRLHPEKIPVKNSILDQVLNQAGNVPVFTLSEK